MAGQAGKTGKTGEEELTGSIIPPDRRWVERKRGGRGRGRKRKIEKKKKGTLKKTEYNKITVHG